METIEKLEGAWETIYGDLQGIHELVENQTGNIPALLLEEKKLKKIVNQWNELAGFGMFLTLVYIYPTGSPSARHTSNKDFLLSHSGHISQDCLS